MTIKTFADGSFLEYAPGNFDDWCVYMVNPNKGFRSPPRDTHYFDFLLQNAERFGADRVYRDFVSIYENTGKLGKRIKRLGVHKLLQESAGVDHSAKIYHCDRDGRRSG